MATLNLSTNGPSIKRSYESIVNSPLPSGAAANSSTYGQWAVFSVSAPLANAFQPDTGKESVLKVQSTGEGELADLVDEFSDGRVQFAFVKVKDPNTGLAKFVLIAWCGDGVPERTKGYFTSHLAAVSKLLHGYHVQITARSENDITPEGIVQKVADSSGAKYSGGPAAPAPSGPPPPVASKPVFTPTRVGGASSGFNPLGSRARPNPTHGDVDNDGWGADAPPVTRTQLEKVEPAYKPTKVNLSELTSKNNDQSRSSTPQTDSGASDVVRGGYQPIGKVDIAAIRRQAKETGSLQDDRPAPVKGSYEPVGKVDIAAIRAKAQGPSGASSPAARQSPVATGASAGGDDAEYTPKSLAERSAAFTQSERLTSLPKPKVANRFGSTTSTFTGTKAPTPVGIQSKPIAPSAPIGTASKTFADKDGKTPAQLWAEKKARERGLSGASDTQPATSLGATSPVRPQASGEGGWKSGYSGKSWAPVQTTHTGRSANSNISQQNTGANEQPGEETGNVSGGVSALKDRFAGAAPMGAPTNRPVPEPSSPPPMNMASKPNAGAARGVPMPGLPSRPAQPAEEEEEGIPDEQPVNVPPPPRVPRSPSPPTPDEMRSSSPVRIAMPVARGAETRVEPPEERLPPPPVPTAAVEEAAERARDPSPEPQVQEDTTSRGAGQAVAEATFGAAAAANTVHAAQSGGKRAIAQYDYEKAEDNEIALHEGEEITNIDMVDDDWWMGQNSKGETGLFPSNYVELVEDDAGEAPSAAAAPAAPSAPEPPAAPPAPAGTSGPTATALYDYEAAEDNELSFPENAKLTDLEFPDEDWWFGHYNGRSGLFPANYVQLDE